MEIFTKHGIQYNKNIISELYFKFTRGYTIIRNIE